MAEELTARERKALEQREANEQARRSCEPLPYPNPWDDLDPTKLPRDASPEAIHSRVIAFSKICRRPPCKRHTL